MQTIERSVVAWEQGEGMREVMGMFLDMFSTIPPQLTHQFLLNYIFVRYNSHTM